MAINVSQSQANAFASAYKAASAPPSNKSASSAPAGSVGATYRNASGQLINSAGEVVGGAVTSRGQLTNDGQTVIPGSVRFTDEGLTAPITQSSLAPVTAVNLPNPPAVNPAYSSVLAEVAGAYQPLETSDEVEGVGNLQSLADLVRSEMPKPEDNTKLYEDTYGVSAKQTQQDALAARSRVNSLTSQINSINAAAQASILAETGQGRGIPEAIIGGRQAQLAKEAAIRVLPLAAELSAAQNDLKTAEAHLDRLFELRIEDAKMQYEYKTNLFNAVVKIATEAEKRQFEAKQKALDRAYEQVQKNIERQDMYAKLAFENGEGYLGSSIASIDPQSSDFGAKLGRSIEKMKGKIPDTDTIELTATDRQGLLAANFTEADISNIEKDIKSYGIDEAVKGMTDAQKAAVKKVYGGEDNTQFLTKDFFETSFTDDQLKTSAEEAGYRGMWSKWETEKKNYLDYLETLVKQYRTAGYTDKEILKMMQ